MASKKILTLVREKQAACKRIEAGEEQIHQLKNLLVTMKALKNVRRNRYKNLNRKRTSTSTRLRY